jgi:hypothetical protein
MHSSVAAATSPLVLLDFESNLKNYDNETLWESLDYDGDGSWILEGKINRSLIIMSVSSRPRVPSYAIGRDRGEEWPRVLRVSTVIPTPPHDFIWRSQMEMEKGNGRRDQKEPRQTMQKKDNAPNNQLKRNRKMEDKKKGSLHPRKLSPQKCLQRNKKQ